MYALKRTAIFCLLTLTLAGLTSPADAGPAPAPKPEAKPAAPEIAWKTDYAEAMRLAVAQRKALFVYLGYDQPGATREAFEKQSLADAAVRRKLADMVAVRLPLDATISVDGKKVRLLDHGSFAELAGGPGAAIVDLAHPDKPYYHHVVSALPLVAGKYYQFQPNHLAVMLDLPPGTITQRTLVFAVRIHPEAPASTLGQADNVLVQEAESHSNYQAQIRVQGHHHWNTRFQRLLGLLPRAHNPREVCAESWPNEKLVDAAVDCVGCWRQSSGHWSAVSANQPLFGYDMQRGSNGIWYATGVFAGKE
jgi:hypothetical protein